jgi:hypothetical protein
MLDADYPNHPTVARDFPKQVRRSRSRHGVIRRRQALSGATGATGGSACRSLTTSPSISTRQGLGRHEPHVLLPLAGRRLNVVGGQSYRGRVWEAARSWRCLLIRKNRDMQQFVRNVAAIWPRRPPIRGRRLRLHPPRRASRLISPGRRIAKRSTRGQHEVLRRVPNADRSSESGRGGSVGFWCDVSRLVAGRGQGAQR